MSDRLLRTLPLISAILLASGCGPVTFVVGVQPGDQALTDTVVERDGRWTGERVAIVDVSGLIVNADTPQVLRPGENPVSLLYEQLEEARQDRRVKAVVLRLNTPGGTVTASDAMYRQVRRFRQRSGKPVVALMMDVAASGGYYVACAADEIVAYPTSVTGSIGVIMQTFSVRPALSKIGIVTDAVTTGAHKDAGSPFSTLTPEQRAVFQGIVDDFYGRFVKVVRTARPDIPPDRFEQVTDGRVFTGDQAAKVGLVDRVGDLQSAFARAKKLAGIDTADLVMYHRRLEYVGSPYAHMPGLPGLPGAGALPGAGTQINLAQINLSHSVAQSPVGFFYLWQPHHP